jgi:hypothetical protein
MTKKLAKTRNSRPLHRLVGWTRRVVLHGYVVPVFIWDHDSPPRMFLPTLTGEPVNLSDRKCTITIEWQANAKVSDSRE